MEDDGKLWQTFDRLDERLRRLERSALEQEALLLEMALPESADIVRLLLSAYGLSAGKDMPETDDLLQLFGAFVKGDPSLNAVRDNVRELVYYRNCLALNRCDALPPASAKMAVRTARHIYFYLRSRCERQGLPE